MRLPGGEAGGMINVLPGAPVLREGELVVLFLRARAGDSDDARPRPGNVPRRARRATRAGLLVTPPPLKASAAGRIIRGAAERRTLTLDAFERPCATLGAAR